VADHLTDAHKFRAYALKSSFQLLVREHQSSDSTAQITITAGDYFINRRFVDVEKSTGVCV
jgi:hypothetical protein